MLIDKGHIPFAIPPEDPKQEAAKAAAKAAKEKEDHENRAALTRALSNQKTITQLESSGTAAQNARPGAMGRHA